MSVPQRVKIFLKEKKLSQSDFCKLTGYSISNFSNFLIGKTTNPRIDLIHAFTTHFPELSINWLFTGDGSMWTNGEGGSPLKVVQEEPEEVDPEKEVLKDELLSMYKRRVMDLEREIRQHAPDLAVRLEI